MIVPVFNGADRLAAAVASIRPELSTGDEIIVIDDGSTDRTAAVIGSLGHDIVALKQPNRGAAAARNAGLMRASGELLAFSDHDDIWVPGRQAALRNCLVSDPSIDVAVGLLDIMVEDGLPQPALGHPRYVTTHRRWHLGALLMRRRAFDRVGLFEEGLKNAEDADWFMRAEEAGVRFANVGQVTSLYRLHRTNLSRNVEDGRTFLLEALKGRIGRRRAT